MVVRMHHILTLGVVLSCLGMKLSPAAAQSDITPHPGTKPLTWEGDIASRLVEQADSFLLQQLEASIAKRGAFWKRDGESPEAYERSIQPNRDRLKHILGIRSERTPFESLELTATTTRPAKIGESESFKVYTVRWPVVRDMWSEGLLLEPKEPCGLHVVALPDADQTPEEIAGLVEGTEPAHQFARRLAESGCRVVIPALISRHREKRLGGAVLTSREFVHRSAYELGRHLAGYEIQKTLAAVDWFERSQPGDANIAVVGWGEGGMIALYAAAIDRRIDAALVSGYFDSRQNIWSQPIDRSVFGLLEQFGDAEIASMIATRRLIIDRSQGPELVVPGQGGAPAELKSPDASVVAKEYERAVQLASVLESAPDWRLTKATPAGVSTEALSALLGSFQGELAKNGPQPTTQLPENLNADRQRRLLHQIDVHNQWLLNRSARVREKFMSKLDYSSLERYQETSQWYRDHFRHEVIGSFDIPLTEMNPRSRKIKETDDYVSYEVVLDVMPGVFAYGILIRPKGIGPEERRPVVVCQHGLEGRPQDIVQGNHRAYHDFAAKLAERGFVTFSPQNIYIFQDRFRTLQRKSYPIKKTLFSIIVPQHQQIVNWLSKQDYVDPKRIAFYGLSYGGKSAMRIPPLVEDYCLSICSADFNEWVWKNAASIDRYTYVRTGEYEIFEFDLGSTFNYAEMAALIAPRPFMVERGHFDGVAPDETVAFEYAKVRHLYAARLFIPERTEIEWFYGEHKGIHTINGQGTYDFLHKHLNWPKPKD